MRGFSADGLVHTQFFVFSEERGRAGFGLCPKFGSSFVFFGCPSPEVSLHGAIGKFFVLFFDPGRQTRSALLLLWQRLSLPLWLHDVLPLILGGFLHVEETRAIGVSA